jgi:hypothetical protein
VLKVDDWVCAVNGKGKRVDSPNRERHFEKSSIGLIEEIDNKNQEAVVYLVGLNERWIVPLAELQAVDVKNTGDKHSKKICNTCHRLLPTTKFARNQNNVHGVVRRPACEQCRTDIDKRAPKSSQAKKMEKTRPAKGSLFQCPICERRSIVGVTAKIVADHNHHTGNIRDFICDSCNTGLGRFKNGQNHLHNAIRYLEERDGG